MLRALIIVGFCFLLPGYLGWLVFSPHSRQHQRVSYAMWSFSVILSSVLWTGWWGFVLLQLGRFSLTALIAGNALLSLSLVALNWLQKGVWYPYLRRPTKEEGLLAIALFLAALLFLHPHEFVFGGADAGVYASLGANIARTGRWTFREPEIARLPSTLYTAFFREQPEPALARYIHVPGFYVTEPASGEVTPQFYALHPLWMAIFYTVGGLKLSLFAAPLWGTLGVLAVFFVTKALFGTRAGLVSMVLLSFSATQIWFSRYPTSEVLTQFLVFAGLWAFIRYLGDRSAWHAGLAGAALGQVMLVRLDLYFLVAIPLIYGLYHLMVGRLAWRDGVFMVPFGLQLMQSLWFARAESWPYFYAVYGRYLERMADLPILVLAAGASSVALLGFMVVAYFGFGPGLSPKLRTRFNDAWNLSMRILSIVVVLAAVYAYFIRPSVVDTSRSYYYWYGNAEIPYVEPYNMVRLGWYLTPLGLLMATMGTWRLLRRHVDAGAALLLGVGLLYSVIFIANSRNNPHHIYVMRRYVPVVIPFIFTMVAYAVDYLWRQGRWFRYLAVVSTVVLAVWLLVTAKVEIFHVEYAGLTEQMAALDEALGDMPAIILFNDDLAVSTGAFLGTPLHYIYGHTVFDLQEGNVDPDTLAAQVETWLDEGNRVVLAEGAHAVPGLFSPLAHQPLADISLTYATLEVSYDYVPKAVLSHTMDVRFYEAVTR